MALDVYFSNDIRRALVAGLVMAVEVTRANGDGNPAHLAGALALAKHQAAAFGLSWPGLVQEARQALGDPGGGLLGAGG